MVDGAEDQRLRSASAGTRAPGASPLARLRSAAAPLFASSTRSPGVQTPPPATALPATASVGEEIGARVVARHEAARRATEQKKAEADAAAASAAAGGVEEALQVQHTPRPATAHAGDGEEGSPSAQGAVRHGAAHRAAEQYDLSAAEAAEAFAVAGGAGQAPAATLASLAPVPLEKSRMPEDDAVSLRSSVSSRAPHLIARDVHLMAANVSLLSVAFDELGVERIEQVLEFDTAAEFVNEVSMCQKSVSGKVCSGLQRKSLEKLYKKVRGGSGPPVEGVQSEPTPAIESTSELANESGVPPPTTAGPETPAPEQTAMGQSNKQPGPFAVRNQKRAAKAKETGNPAPLAKESINATPLASATPGRANASKSASAAAAPSLSVSELLGKPEKTTKDTPPAEEAAVKAAFIDATCVPLTTHVFTNAWSPACGKSAIAYLNSLLEVTRGDAGPADPEMKAEALECILAQCVDLGGLDLYDDGPLNPRTLRMEIAGAWAQVQKVAELQSTTERKAAERAEREKVESVPPPPEKGAALAAAIAAAGLTTANGPQSGNDEAMDVGRSRVKKVADDNKARELLASLRKQGEAVLSTSDAAEVETFIKAQADAQVGSASIAELLLSSNLPTPKGVYADPDATINMLAGLEGSVEGAHLARCASVARDAVKVRQAILHVIELKIERKLKFGDAKRMAEAVLNGSILQVDSASGTFKPTEMSAARALGLFLPGAKNPRDAKVLVEGMADGLSTGLRIAHPHDRSIEDAMSDAKAAATGPSDDREYHNQVYGELFKQLAKLWAAWRDGKSSVLPTLASAWAKTLRHPRMVELLAGRTELEAKADQAIARAEKAEAAAAEAKKEAASAKAAKAAPRLKDHPPAKPPGGETERKTKIAGTGETAPIFKISGAERRAYRAEHLDPLYPKVRQAKADAEAATKAGAADASAKGEAVKALESEIEKHKAVLAAKA